MEQGCGWMKPERWQKVEQIYHSALKREPVQRATFLDEACGGDDSLRQEVESLLTQEGATGSFLEAPALEVAARSLAQEQAGSEGDGGGMVGKTISRYRVLAKLGAGGMGEVYRAHDERLQRDVALKVLPAHILADETARNRFRKEALALSKLNHPHIATVYDFDTQDGVDFLVMEYVAGATLAKRITDGALPEKEVAQLGIQIAAALEEAQEQGVVHRDLKPGNVMVTPKGQVKVLDFGLAKLVRPVADTAATMSMTETPAAAGTLPYMPPEQLQGKVVDVRADLYALGAVLYEMGTGQRAFPERESHRLIAAILQQTPPAPGEVNSQVSAGLESIIFKALEKDPERRYQSAQELRVDLERLSGPEPFLATPRRPGLTRRQLVAMAGVALVALLAVPLGLNVGGLRDRLLGTAPAPRIESIAVLPLANLSGDPEQDYFAAGMHEALITDLAKIGGFKRVIARSSAMRYQDTDKPLPQIARELNVDAVITGSVLRSGDRVRITAQLINAATEEHLWAERYERELRDVLSLQNEIVAAIAREINLQLTPEEQTRLASARTVNPEAHEAVLRGSFHIDKLNSEDIETAMQYFELALKKDPNYARAYLGIGGVWFVRTLLEVVPPREAGPRAKAAVLKALELDDTLSEAHSFLAYVRFSYEWDWAGAQAEFRRAIELNPNSAEVRALYGDFLTAMNRPEEATAHLERALELDPFNFKYQVIYGWHLFYVRRYDDAISQFRKVLKKSPNDRFSLFSLTTVFIAAGMYAEHRELNKKFINAGLSTDGVAEEIERGYAQGGFQEAMRRGAEMLAAQSKLAPPMLVAYMYTYAGENDLALEWLERSYEARTFGFHFLKAGPEWDPLRDDPRFQDLLRRMNFPE